VKQSANNLQNPLKGGFLVGSHCMFWKSKYKIKYKIINGEHTRNPTKHTPLTLVKQLANNQQNPLKGGFLVGSHFMFWKSFLKIKHKIINGEPNKTQPNTPL
jgi:hypothetical protein